MACATSLLRGVSKAFEALNRTSKDNCIHLIVTICKASWFWVFSCISGHALSHPWYNIGMKKNVFVKEKDPKWDVFGIRRLR